jgi:hypothetical protein
MALGPHAAREQGRRPNWICEHRVLVQYQGHHGGQGQPGLSVTRRKTTPLLREPTRNEATGGFSGPAGHVHSQRRKTKSTERGVTDGSLERASGANSRAHAVAPKCDIQLGHPTPPALSQLRLVVWVEGQASMQARLDCHRRERHLHTYWIAP